MSQELNWLLPPVESRHYPTPIEEYTEQVALAHMAYQCVSGLKHIQPRESSQPFTSEALLIRYGKAAQYIVTAAREANTYDLRLISTRNTEQEIETLARITCQDTPEPPDADTQDMNINLIKNWRALFGEDPTLRYPRVKSVMPTVFLSQPNALLQTFTVLGTDKMSSFDIATPRHPDSTVQVRATNEEMFAVLAEIKPIWHRPYEDYTIDDIRHAFPYVEITVDEAIKPRLCRAPAEQYGGAHSKEMLIHWLSTHPDAISKTLKVTLQQEPTGEFTRFIAYSV